MISTIDEHRGAFMCRSTTLAVWADSGPFHGLLLTDLGSLRISMINEPRGAFMYRLSTFLDLSDSGLFHGLLLTVWGSQSGFHGCLTPRCAYVSVINNRSFGRLWLVSWTITQFWGPELIFMIHEHWGAFMCRSSILTILADSGPFHALLLTVLGPRTISTIDDP